MTEGKGRVEPATRSGGRACCDDAFFPASNEATGGGADAVREGTRAGALGGGVEAPREPGG